MEQETEHQISSQDEQASHEVHHKTKRKLRKAHKISLAVFVAALIIVIGGGLAWVYTGNISSAKEKVFKALPLPAAIVDMKFVSAESVLDRADLSKQLLEAQGMGDKANTGQVFDQIVDVKKLEAVASQRGVKAPNSEIDEEYKNIITQYAGGDEGAFTKELDSTYHMKPEKFKSEVVRQQVLQSNLLLWYSKQEDLNKTTYEKARELQSKLNNGQSFEEVAKQFSEDEATKDFAGDSGMIAFDDLLPEFRESLKDSKAGDTQLVVSRYGLHVLKLLEVNNDGENGAKQVHLQQIFLKQKGFSDWLDKEVGNIRVLKLLKFS